MAYRAIPRVRMAAQLPDDPSMSQADDHVIVDDAPQPTGLLNADGVPLYRVRETVPIGFRGKVKR